MTWIVDERAAIRDRAFSCGPKRSVLIRGRENFPAVVDHGVVTEDTVCIVIGERPEWNGVPILHPDLHTLELHPIDFCYIEGHLTKEEILWLKQLAANLMSRNSLNFVFPWLPTVFIKNMVRHLKEKHRDLFQYKLKSVEYLEKRMELVAAYLTLFRMILRDFDYTEQVTAHTNHFLIQLDGVTKKERDDEQVV